MLKLTFWRRAIINRYGFNSEGIVAVAKRLGAQHGKRRLAETTRGDPFGSDGRLAPGNAGAGIIGVNLGKNKTSEDAAADYVQGVHTLSQYADYLVRFCFHKPVLLVFLFLQPCNLDLFLPTCCCLLQHFFLMCAKMSNFHVLSTISRGVLICRRY